MTGCCSLPRYDAQFNNFPARKKVLRTAKSFSTTERLVLAKLLLDSLVIDEAEDTTDWLALGLAAFEKDWDNPDDAIYDDWREAYAVDSPDVNVDRLIQLLSE